jgi:hypothetical protein
VQVLHDSEQCRVRHKIVIRWITSKQLNHSASKGPDVALNTCRGFIDYGFRSHPVGSPCRRQCLLGVVDLNGNSKIGDFSLAFFSQEYVGALKISVGNMMLMEILQSFEHLFDILFDKFFLKWGFLHKRAQGPAFQILKHQINAIVELNGVNVLDDKGVTELFEHINLKLNVLNLCFLYDDLLDGHERPFGHVDSLVDHTVAAPAQQVEHLVLLDLFWT